MLSESMVTDRTAAANLLIVWVIGLLVSLWPHDTLHVAGPAKLTCNKSTRWRCQTLGDHSLLNLFNPQSTLISLHCSIMISWFRSNSNHVRSWPLTQNVNIIVSTVVWHGKCTSNCWICSYYISFSIFFVLNKFLTVHASVCYIFCSFIIYSEKIRCLHIH